MKLFYKKDYEMEVKNNNKLKVKLVESEIKNDNIQTKLDVAKKQLKASEEFKQMMIDLNEELIVEVEKKEKKLKEKEKEIEELKSDRYLVKKIPSGRKPRTQKTKITHIVKPNIQKYQRNEVADV